MYATVSVAVCAPTVIVTVGGIYWLSVQLGLSGAAQTAYFAVGVFVLMFVFSMLHKFVQLFGGLLLGGTRSPIWQV